MISFARAEELEKRYGGAQGLRRAEISGAEDPPLRVTIPGTSAYCAAMVPFRKVIEATAASLDVMPEEVLLVASLWLRATLDPLAAGYRLVITNFGTFRVKQRDGWGSRTMHFRPAKSILREVRGAPAEPQDVAYERYWKANRTYVKPANTSPLCTMAERARSDFLQRPLGHRAERALKEIRSRPERCWLERERELSREGPLFRAG
jgi:hypothetical protein